MSGVGEGWKPVGALGFGCVGLTALDNDNDALRLLGCVFDNGIRHFDTARAYGSGMSEQILGRFLKGRRHAVTVTTKFGIEPPGYVRNMPFLNSVKRTLKKIPMVDRRVRRVVSAGNAMGRFGVDAARRSLEASLRALDTDYVDIWLLHEARLDDARNDGLRAFLESSKQAGKVRQIGIGSAFAKLGSDCALLPEPLNVVQFENSATERNLDSLANAGTKYIVTHSAFKHIRQVQEILSGQSEWASTFYARFGLNPAVGSDLTKLLLAWAVRNNPSGCVLFGSTSVDHVRENASILSDSRISAEALTTFSDCLEALRTSLAAARA